MDHVSVQKIRDANQARPLMRETEDLLAQVRTRAYELFERRGGSTGNDMADWLVAERELMRIPDVELAEDDKEFQLQLALPGFDAKDIHVAVLRDAVIVEGDATHKHHRSSGTIHFCEFGERRVFREIALPKPADIEHVSAVLDKGVLQVSVPKAEQGKGKRVAA